MTQKLGYPVTLRVMTVTSQGPVVLADLKYATMASALDKLKDLRHAMDVGLPSLVIEDDMGFTSLVRMNQVDGAFAFDTLSLERYSKEEGEAVQAVDMEDKFDSSVGGKGYLS